MQALASGAVRAPFLPSDLGQIISGRRFHVVVSWIIGGFRAPAAEHPR